MRPTRNHHGCSTNDTGGGYALVLGLVLFVASVGSAATSGVVAIERTCVARLTGHVAQALRERAVVAARDAAVEPEVVETPNAIVHGGRVQAYPGTGAALWMLDLPPPAVV